MKNKFNRKLLITGLIGLFLFIAMNPAIVQSNDTQQIYKELTKSTTTNTYNIKETYIWGIIENQTNVKYNLVFIRKDNSFGLFKDISIQGNTRYIHIWFFPLLSNLFKGFQKPNFDIVNRSVTLKIRLLLHGNIYVYHGPDSFWFEGRAIGVTLTIDE